MPGIHVRTSGKPDWVKREKEPVLTVPGSYWLCHKNYIYKFTFKYHKSSKDAKEFNYGKELMKVIRRIIKSQPRQGQQFGTRHLLVTYNPSSWTRQDKMFAMLKFRDRKNATAFSRAFVLTVKLLSTSQTSDSNTEYDDDLIVYEKKPKQSQWDDPDPEKIEINGELPREMRLPSSVTLDDTSSDSSTKLTSFNSTEIETDGNLPLNKLSTMKERPKKINSASFFADLDDLPLLERYILEQRDEPEGPTSANNENLNEIQETVDMPYQYQIEREIERTKMNVSSQEPPDKSSREKRAEETLNPRNRSFSTSQIIDNATARSANITDLVMEGLMFTIRQDQDSITVMEQKTKLEPDEVLENSEKVETSEGAECLVNSSLLKLENLITKIEMSATNAKASSRCEENQSIFLPNSFSAINVNMAENIKNGPAIPLDNETTDPITPEVNLEANKCNKPTVDNFIAPITPARPLINHHNTLNGPAFPLVKINLNNVQEVLTDTFSFPIPSISIKQEINPIDEFMEEDKMEQQNGLGNQQIQSNKENETDQNDNDEDEEEEDIVPEAFQQDTNHLYCDDENTFPSVEHEESNLLMDDLESEKSPSSLHKNQVKNKSKAPRIISNEIVKYDLSTLRSSRLRPRLDKTTDVDKSSTSTAEIPQDNSSRAKTPVDEKSRPSDSEKIQEQIQEVPIPTRRRLTARRRLGGQRQDEEDGEIAIEMGKFVQDMTHGVRVVLQRLDLSSISGVLGKRSCPPNCIN